MENNQDISPEELEAMERYLNDHLTPEERVELENRLSSDEAFRSKLSEVQLLMTGVGEAALREKLNDFHNEMPATAPVRTMKPQTSSSKKWLVAAALIFIVATAGWFLLNNRSGNEKLYADYFKPDPGLITAMSAGVENYAFEKAMIDYKKGDYKTAIAVWDSLQKQQPTSDTLNYFLGVAYLADDNAGAAIPYLQKVTTAKDSFLQPDAFWYTGLALLKEGKKAEAVNFIKQSNHSEKEKLLAQLQ